MATGAEQAQANRIRQQRAAQAAAANSARSQSIIKKKGKAIEQMPSATEKAAKKSLLKRVAKISTLPKTVRESIPLRGFMNNGIIETEPGVFTKSYKLQDINFSIAPTDEQHAIFQNFMDFLNSFESKSKWQFVIFNHEIDKRTTIENIRIAPQRDGLNKHRKEMNEILMNKLKEGNNSITQDKYLVVSVDDTNAEHAATVLRRLDGEVNKKIRKITGNETSPLTTQERMKVLYDIYNQDFDYRMVTGVYDKKEKFDLAFVEKCGLSVKDVIGPPSFDFSSSNSFMVGDTYAQAMYLERVPAFLTTNFIADLADVQCSMLISTTSESIETEEGMKMVKNQLASIEARATAITKRNNEDGYFGSLPPELENSIKNARELMSDITGRDQKLFYITFLVVVFARTREQLEENVKLVKSVGSKHLCPIKVIKFQQEAAFNTALPLCRNDVFVDNLYTTESAAVFIPYNSQEIKQENAIFYGLNQVTKSMILSDRLSGDNYNGLVFGYSGSGKSFTVKCEMMSVLLNHPDSQVFVVDPQGEYYPMTKAFNGERIRLAPGSNIYLNPLDLDISEDVANENDPITMKSDFVRSMFSIMIGEGRTLDPVHTSIIDQCVRKIYRPYIEHLHRNGLSVDLAQCPTLSDLYQELLMMREERFEAAVLSDVLYQYAAGSFQTFAHRTNVQPHARFVVYDTKNLGSGMKELGLHICTNDIWNRMISNSKKHIYTWFYIDEFHLLLESSYTTKFLRRLWKMARKWQGVPTGIMQNTEDLLRDDDTRAIINNSSFVIMLHEPLMDRQNLQELFTLSNAQLEYITNSQPGHGLIYNGKVILPFAYDFPMDSPLYKMMDTSHKDGSLFA